MLESYDPRPGAAGDRRVRDDEDSGPRQREGPIALETLPTKSSIKTVRNSLHRCNLVKARVRLRKRSGPLPRLRLDNSIGAVEPAN